MRATVRHCDRNGKEWAFDVDTNPECVEAFKRLLIAARNIGNLSALRLSYYRAFDCNEAFCTEVERVVLSALSQRFPVVADQVETLRAKPQETPPPITSVNEPDESEMITYYWQND